VDLSQLHDLGFVIKLSKEAIVITYRDSRRQKNACKISELLHDAFALKIHFEMDQLQVFVRNKCHWRRALGMDGFQTILASIFFHLELIPANHIVLNCVAWKKKLVLIGVQFKGVDRNRSRSVKKSFDVQNVKWINNLSLVCVAVVCQWLIFFNYFRLLTKSSKTTMECKKRLWQIFSEFVRTRCSFMQ